MATAPSYIEGQTIPRENGLIENLMDFSFQRPGDAAHAENVVRRSFAARIDRRRLARLQRLSNVHVQRIARAYSQRPGHDVVGCLLPYRCGTSGRSVPRRPGHHEFAELIYLVQASACGFFPADGKKTQTAEACSTLCEQDFQD